MNAKSIKEKIVWSTPELFEPDVKNTQKAYFVAESWSTSGPVAS